MKYISIDANSINYDVGEIYISDFTVRYFGLKDGMEFYAYEGADIWNAVIHKYISDEKNESWYVELRSFKETLNDEHLKWGSISASNGICIGEEIMESKIINRLIDHGYSLNQISEIVKLDDGLKKKLSKIKDL